MAIGKVLTLARRRLARLPPLSSLHHSARSASTSTSTSSSAVEADDLHAPSVRPPLIPYDRLSDAIRSEIKRLDDPDPRFPPSTRVTTLPNGLRVATESSLASRTATVGVWIDAGSRFETEENNGTAHFLEHIITRSATQIVGGIHAYTAREHTAYITKVMDKDVARSIEIFADILQNPCIDQSSISRERDLILQEMEEVVGQTDEVILDHLHAAAFQYTPLGRTILGPAQNIKTITKEHLKNYISTHYTAPRMIISATGAVKHEDIVEQAKKLFTKLATDPTTTSQLVAKEPAAFTGSEVRMIDGDVPLAHIAVAFNGAPCTDPDFVAFLVIQFMFGPWNKNTGGGMHMCSELVLRVASNDIAESMKAFNRNYKDTGLFGVYAVAKPDCLDDLALEIMQEISKLSYLVSDPDVTRARNQLKSAIRLQLDGISVAIDIGRQMLSFGRRMPVAELFARIDAVDASTVKRVANRFIFDQGIAIAAMGPIESLPDYNWFRRHTFLNRH